MTGLRCAAPLALALVLCACTGGGEEPQPVAPGDRFNAARTVTVTPTSVVTYATTADTSATASVQLTVSSPPESTLWVSVAFGGWAIQSTELEPVNSVAANIRIQYKSPSTLGSGTHYDSLNIRVCYDQPCTSQVSGSPLFVTVSLAVTGDSGGGGGGGADPGPVPEPGIEALPIDDPQALGHDVIDAEYSDALDAIVMVSSWPTSALYVYDPASRTEQSIALDKPPTAVSVGPDGTSAAVGHDALITVVDLTRLGDALVSPKTLLNVSARLSDVVLAGNGYAYGFPAVDQWEEIHSVHIATNTETLSGYRYIYAGTPAKLHPAGNRIYGATNLSPSDLERYDISTGTARFSYDSPYHGGYESCGRLWMDQGGAHIYTACGNVFRPTDARSQDMLYTGKLELSQHQYSGARIVSLSKSAQRREVALLDEDAFNCGTSTSSPCYTHAAFYESDYLTLGSRYSLAPVTIDAVAHAQRGVFIFHTADGTQRLLISRLVDVADRADEYRIGTVSVAGSVPVGASSTTPPAAVVNASNEAGLAAAPLTGVTALPHDVVDAEFSPALNAVVMASTFPVNAVYVHDMATRAERSIALAHAPTAISVAPGGTQAALGHDGKVTVVDLAATGAASPKVLATTIDVLDVVMGGNGYVYAFPRYDQWENIHSINIATGVTTTSSGSIYAGTRARLHPSGTKLYGADNGLSPSDIERYPIVGGTAQVGADSPYHGDYAMCGNLWFSESGTNIYTACGNTFRSSDTPSLDMTYVGALPLSGGTYGYRIASVSDSLETAEIAAIEYDADECGPYGYYYDTDPCRTHLNLYGSAFLTLTTRYSLSPFTVGSQTYDQHGAFVFHSANGTQRYVLSRLFGMPNPYAEYYLSRLP